MIWTNEELDKLLDEAVQQMIEEEKDKGIIITKSRKSGLDKFRVDFKKPEEKCGQCKRMKDIGEKCWWCGCK